MKWQITYYNKKVFEEISTLPKGIKAKYVAITDTMAEYGPDLGLPHTRALKEGLFEIRVKGQEGIARIFYCTVVKHEILILHSFIKKTQKIPQQELELARKRVKEVRLHD